jgi:hypothetical protein
MTLKERFKQWLDTDPREQIREVPLEIIAEDFAIGFADWIRVCKLKERSYDFDNIEELLKTYKEEKGL